MIKRLPPSALAFLYAGFASAWIVLSGHALNFITDDPGLLERLEILKGIGFVAVTTLLLYVLLKVQGHAQAGYEILHNVEFPWPVAEVTRQHHERIDGTGYPRGLKGEDILLEARILAVADVVEAMSSHRPYRPGLGVDNALANIEQGRGAKFDPQVVDACLRMFRQEGYKLPA